MYCIRKFADCWAVFNLDTEQSRPLTAEEVAVVGVKIPSLTDPQVAAFYSDDIDCISDKP
jgi:hypothetical protein